MPKKTGRDPAQYGLFATPLEAMIAPDAEVRVIAAFVDQLNLLELDFQPINNMGASAYGPAAHSGAGPCVGHSGFDTELAKSANPSVRLLPLFPDTVPQAVSDPGIQFSQLTPDFAQLEIAQPATHQGVDTLNAFFN